jgi:hypothetical protein
VWARKERERTKAELITIPPALVLLGIAPLLVVMFGLSAWELVESPDLSTIASNATPTLYGLNGDKVYRFDADGGETVAADRSTETSPTGDIDDVLVGGDQRLFLADPALAAIAVYGPDARYRTSLSTGLEPTSLRFTSRYLSMTFDGRRGLYALTAGRLFHFDDAGSPQLLAKSKDLAGIPSIARFSDGRLVFCELADQRILISDGTATQTIDCPTESQGQWTPQRVAISPAGRLYVVLYPPSDGSYVSFSMWDMMLGRTQARERHEALYELDPATAAWHRVDARSNGEALHISQIAFTGGDSAVVKLDDSNWLYRLQLASPQQAERIDSGALGARSKRADTYEWIQAHMFPIMFIVGMLVPLLIVLVAMGVRALLLRRRYGQARGAS